MHRYIIILTAAAVFCGCGHMTNPDNPPASSSYSLYYDDSIYDALAADTSTKENQPVQNQNQNQNQAYTVSADTMKVLKKISAPASQQEISPAMIHLPGDAPDNAIDTANEDDENGAAEDEQAGEEDSFIPVIDAQTFNPEMTLDDALELFDLSKKHWQRGDMDQAFNALDEAYYLLLKTETEENPELTRQKDELRYMISKFILEIYDSRKEVARPNHDEIQIYNASGDLNQYVQAEVSRMTTGRHGKFFKRAYAESGKYRPMILEELEKAGLPSELSWLPLIESGFKNRALSRAKALGLWQFIPSTGYKFGLKRDRYIDERMDPVKSTRAAIAYLRLLHQIFGDWTTALASYNCGEGRVLKVIQSQDTEYFDSFWDIFQKLPRETARYVPKFLATIHIVNHLEKYGLDNLTPDTPPDFETITVNRQVNLNTVAKTIGISSKKLKAINTELRLNILPGYAYNLRIPVGKKELLLSKLDKLPISSPPKYKFKTVHHKVRKGETLSTIAKKYRTSVNTLLRHNKNKIRRRNYIVAGDVLKIPGKTRVTNVKSKTSKPVHVSKHVVKSGDSLWLIARKYGTTTAKIKSMNRMKGTRLTIGHVLKIPSTRKKSHVSRASSKTYQVKVGDVPGVIATRYNIPVNRLLKINNLPPGGTIYPGQKLYIE